MQREVDSVRRNAPEKADLRVDIARGVDHAAGPAGPVAAERPAARGAGALVLFAQANSSFDSWLSAISR